MREESRIRGRTAIVVGLLAAAITLACATTSGSSGSGAASSGERLYRSHCGACHRLRDPSERTAAEWAAAVEKYGPRAHLDPKDRPAVVRYLQEHSKP